jgi:hypothetical protein
LVGWYLLPLCPIYLEPISNQERIRFEYGSDKDSDHGWTAVAWGLVCECSLMVKALDTNTGIVAIGNDNAGM